MNRGIKARLGAARLLLEDHVGTDSHAVVSRTQAAAVCDLIQRSPLTNEFRAEVVDIALKIQWHGHDSSMVLNSLSPPDALPPNKRRRQQQDYSTLLAFGTQQTWDVLMSDRDSSEVKLEAIIQMAIGLGMRCPTEPTLKFCASFWAVVSEKSLARLQPIQKHTLKQHFKQHYDRARELAPDPVAYLHKLPASPLLLLQNFPVLYKQHYKGDTPVDPSVDPKLVFEFDMTYSCRGGGRSANTMKPPTIMVDTTNGGNGSNIERIASMFMDRIESLQQNQQRLVECMMGGAVLL